MTNVAQTLRRGPRAGTPESRCQQPPHLSQRLQSEGGVGRAKRRGPVSRAVLSSGGMAPSSGDARTGAALDRVTARLALVGADSHDDEDLRARKALLVLISVLILPVAALWGALYLAFGSPGGVVPLVYVAILFGAIAVFSHTRDFAWLLRVGQVDILLAPTLSMILLGGFIDSGVSACGGFSRRSGRSCSARSGRRCAGTSRSSSSSSDPGLGARSSARSGRRCPSGSRARCER